MLRAVYAKYIHLGPLCSQHKNTTGKKILDQRATRDLDALSVHPAILLGKKRGDHGSDVVGMSDTSQCRQPGYLLVDCRVVPHHPATKSVAMAPGATVFTAMPRGPSSFARYLVSTSTAPFMEA